MRVPPRGGVAVGLRRRLRLATIFLLLFLSYHVIGAVVGPIFLDWPATPGQERKEFCLAEARHYASCVAPRR